MNGNAKGNARVDIASVVAFRITFGLLLLAVATRFFLHGWVHEYYVKPTHFFSYYGFRWVKPWPGVGMYVHYGVIAASALAVAVGFFYRIGITVLFTFFTYAHLCDKTNYLNHYYLLSLIAFLMIFLPLHRAGSVDAWRGRVPCDSTIAPWVPWLLRFQLGVVYFFGGVGKLKGDWLLRAQPLRLWLGANTDFPVLGSLLDQPVTAYVFSWAGLLFDLSVPFFLSWRRTRPFAYAAAVGFHLITARLFPLGLFPWIMMALTLVFFSPSWPRRWVPPRWQTSRGWLPRPDEPNPPATIPGAKAASWIIPRWAIPYVLLQLTWPLRGLLYPGQACWTEEGFRFSWNVMLMEKSGTAEFFVRDRATGRECAVDSRVYLTAYQRKMMSTQPDMILEAAHWIADDYRRRGFHDFAVRVETYVALNGRFGRPLIDPEVDLSQIEDSLAPKRWVLPL